jgi:hypothetical protein
MTYFHGQGGHAISHFKRWKSTPVQPDTSREDEAAARNLSNRVDPELCDRSGGGNSWTDYSIPLVWHPYFFWGYFAHSLAVHIYKHSSKLYSATAV